MSDWTVRVFPDLARPGQVRVNARNGCRVLNLERIAEADAPLIDFERAWKREPFLPARAVMA